MSVPKRKSEASLNKKRKCDDEQEEEIFDALEKFNGAKFPICIKGILRYAAYDSISSCVLLNEQRISDVEQFITENGRSFIESLVCCNSTTYQSQQTFRFLPGHKTSILAIPNQIHDMQATKKKKLKPLTEFKKLMTSAELKELLLKKLSHGVEKLGFETDSVMNEHLSEVQTLIVNNEMTAKCTIKCFQCDVALNLIYKGSWRLSNLLRHFKSHVAGIESPLHKQTNLSKYSAYNFNRLSSPSDKSCDIQQKINTHSSDAKHLMKKLISGDIHYEDLIEEEAYVLDNSQVVASNDCHKTVGVGNGNTISFNMEVRPIHQTFDYDSNQ